RRCLAENQTAEGLGRARRDREIVGPFAEPLRRGVVVTWQGPHIAQRILSAAQQVVDLLPSVRMDGPGWIALVHRHQQLTFTLRAGREPRASSLKASAAASTWSSWDADGNVQSSSRKGSIQASRTGSPVVRMKTFPASAWVARVVARVSLEPVGCSYRTV